MEFQKKIEKQLKNEPNYVGDNGELKKWLIINKVHI